MRDLERIREVREYRLTGPQVRSLGLSTAVLLVALFVIGYQLGRLRSPIDGALLAPAGSGRDAGALLADLLSRQPGEAALASTSVASQRAPADEALGQTPALVATDATRLPLGEEPIPDSVALAEAEAAAADARGEGTARVVEVIERSFPEEAVPTLPSAIEEPPTVAEIVLPPSLPDARAPRLGAGGLAGPPAGKGFTVQLGAYESLEEARDVFEALRGRGLAPYHVQAEVSGKVWHRIRVGLYEHREQADAAAAELAGVTPFPPFVTRQP